ncbi:MAG: NAD(P)H-hydrate epimerase, partial [Dehalococcoidia bacterium]
QMREVDRLMVEEYSVSLVQMMENAGRNLAELSRRMLRGLTGRRICVIAGAGNNGGGALAAARHAANRGADVNVVLATDASGLSAMPAQQLDALRATGIALLPSGAALPAANLYVDGIVGYSLRGALRGRARDLAASLNAARAPILSLDVPTGLDVDSGEADPAAVRAAATMTLALPKPGLLIPSARPFVGQLYVADISVPAALYARLGLAIPALFSTDTLLRLEVR